GRSRRDARPTLARAPALPLRGGARALRPAPGRVGRGAGHPLRRGLRRALRARPGPPPARRQGQRGPPRGGRGLRGGAPAPVPAPGLPRPRDRRRRLRRQPRAESPRPGGDRRGRLLHHRPRRAAPERRAADHGRPALPRGRRHRRPRVQQPGPRAPASRGRRPARPRGAAGPAPGRGVRLPDPEPPQRSARHLLVLRRRGHGLPPARVHDPRAVGPLPRGGLLEGRGPAQGPRTLVRRRGHPAHAGRARARAASARPAAAGGRVPLRVQGPRPRGRHGL
ncbi:MAG: hypothetical protein AVDCRST_MAG13-3050, partial [uncultured Solirubrobacteraceae bacterium]